MIYKSPFYGLFMKKLLVLPITISIITGCSDVHQAADYLKEKGVFTETETILEPHEVYDVKNLKSKDWIGIHDDFSRRVDAVFKYPYSSLNYLYLGNNELEYRAVNPINELLDKCLENDLKIKSIKYSDSLSYKIANPQIEIDKCITKKANEPMPEVALLLLKDSPIYKTYKDNPLFRTPTNNYKADGVITIKEYMYMFKTLIEIKDAENKIEEKKLISEL